MSILRKPLADIALDDLQNLCVAQVRETSELEFKEKLPFKPTKGQPETDDRWISHGDKVGAYARDALLAELVAFANTEGGTLVLGVVETDDEPRRAKGLSPLPRCEDLARRLADACEDVIEPRLPVISARSIPSAEGAADGFVIMRVGRSGEGPHRLVSDGQFYGRRGERSVKMTVREIKDAVLNLAGSKDVLREMFNRARAADREKIGWARQDAASPDHAQVFVLRATAVPTSAWSISALTARPELWWRGGPFEMRRGEVAAPLEVRYPAREFGHEPRIGLRAWHCHGDSLTRVLTDAARVDAELVRVEEPDPGRVRATSQHLFWAWLNGLTSAVLGQVEHLRRALARDGAEFALQFAIESNVELVPAWSDRELRFDGQGRPFRGVDFPVLPVGPREGFDDVISTMVRDVSNYCGSPFNDRIEIDWDQLIR